MNTERHIAHYRRLRALLTRVMADGWYRTPLRDRLVDKCWIAEMRLMAETGLTFDQVNVLGATREK